MITSRKHSREMSPEDTAELEARVFDLVRDRLLEAVGAGGMWTLQFRTDADTDALFGETIAEVIARDVAEHIALPETVELTPEFPGSLTDADPRADAYSGVASSIERPAQQHEYVHARLVA